MPKGEESGEQFLPEGSEHSHDTVLQNKKEYQQHEK